MKNQQSGNVARQIKSIELWHLRKDEIIRLYSFGNHSQSDMASYYGISQAGFRKVLLRIGISAKSKGRSDITKSRYMERMQSNAYLGIIEKKQINRLLIDQDRLVKLLSYDPETGIFMWRSFRGCQKPDRYAGTLRSNGYLQINIDYKLYFAHRLAWLYIHGKWPADEIDHINMIRNDNRICNLREATSAENKRNKRKLCTNTSGFKGVGLEKSNNKWSAKIMIDGNLMNLGQFYDIADAAAAYARASEMYCGKFSRVA